MKSLTVSCIVAAIVGSAVAAYAAIPDDAGRDWKTSPEIYRLGFAAGGADMVTVLSTQFRYRSLAVQQDQIRSMANCCRMLRC